MSSPELQFIFQSSDLSGAIVSSKSQRKLAQSHAARSAHARKRRLRTVKYQAQNGGGRQSQPQDVHAANRYPISNVVVKPNLITPLSVNRKDPFMSSAKPLNSLEYFLFDHYVTAIIPLMRCNGHAVSFPQRMTTIWVPFALTDSSLLDIMFLASCRHLSASYEQEKLEHQFFTQLAYKYKLQGLRSLRDSISTEAPLLSDATIAKTIMFAYDELLARDIPMLKRHVTGALMMVETKGGAQTLGLDGLLEHLLSNLLVKVRCEVGSQVETVV